MSQLRNSLLGGDRKKLDTFEKLYDDCVYRIKRIKQKNDTLQKNAGTELEDEIAFEVQKQKQFIEEQIKELRQQMDEVERKYRDPEAKNKMKDIKKQAQKEIERNKAVLRQFVNKSFLNVKNAKRSRASGDGDDQGHYFEGGKASLIEDDGGNNYNGNGYQPQHDNYYKSPNDQYLPASNFQRNKQHQQSELDIDYQLQNRLQMQKNELLLNVQKDAEKILNIVTETGNIVAQADQMLDHITDNVVNTNRNVLVANEKLEEASQHQKKAKKKYIIFATIIILAVALVVGIILIVKL